MEQTGASVDFTERLCRICDNCRGEKGSFKCGVAEREQWRYVARGCCFLGKVSGIPLAYVCPDYIETERPRVRYVRRGLAEDDSVLKGAFAAGREALRKFEISPGIPKLYGGKIYRF